MRTGQARVARYRDIQQMLFDENLLDDFRLGDPSDAPDRQVVRVVYGSPRLANASDDSGSFCSSGFNEAPAVVDTLVTATASADAQRLSPPERIEAATPTCAEAQPSTEAHAVAAPTGARFESAVSTHPRFEVAADADVEGSFVWRRFGLGLAVGTAAGGLLLAVLSSY